MFNKIKKNAKVIAKVAAYGVCTAVAYGATMAGTIVAVGKICEGCDEDNPANFGQLVGSMTVGILGTAAATAEAYAGLDVIVNEVEDNWK